MLDESFKSSYILGMIALTFCYGLWQLKAWAWIGSLVLQGISLLLPVFGLLSGGGSNVISIFFAGVMIDYLLQPEVKSAFGK